MTWFKVDDSFWRSKKVRRLGKDRLAAAGLWVLAGDWSADNLTDGFVPWDVIEGWDPRRRYAQRLVSVGLWDDEKHDDEVGVRFHDWPDYQPGSGDVLARRSERAAAGKAGNHRRWHAARGVVDPACPFCTAPPSRPPGRNSDPTSDRVSESLPNPPSRPDPIGITEVPTDAPETYARGASGPTAVGAKRLVQRTIGPEFPAAVRTDLVIRSAELLKQFDEPTVGEALAEWRSRTGIGPGVLASLVADVVKRRNGHIKPADHRPNSDDTIRRLLGSTGTEGATILQLNRGDT